MQERMKTLNLENNLKTRQSAKAKSQLPMQIYWLIFSQLNPHQSISEDWSNDQKSINKPFARTNILKVFPDLFDIFHLLRWLKDLLYANQNSIGSNKS